MPLSTSAIAPSSMLFKRGVQPSLGRAFTKGRDSTGGSTLSKSGPKAAALKQQQRRWRSEGEGSITLKAIKGSYGAAVYSTVRIRESLGNEPPLQEEPAEGDTGKNRRLLYRPGLQQFCALEGVIVHFCCSASLRGEEERGGGAFLTAQTGIDYCDGRLPKKKSRKASQ